MRSPSGSWDPRERWATALGLADAWRGILNEAGE